MERIRQTRGQERAGRQQQGVVRTIHVDRKPGIGRNLLQPYPDAWRTVPGEDPLAADTDRRRPFLAVVGLADAVDPELAQNPAGSTG